MSISIQEGNVMKTACLLSLLLFILMGTESAFGHSAKRFQLLYIMNMYNERVVSGAPFCPENRQNSIAVKRVGTKSVDGFGRKSHKPAILQDAGSPVIY